MAVLHSVGVGVWHKPGFIIDRPQGSGDAVFVHFLTPAEILTEDGVAEGRAGDCILYAPPHAQWYRAAEGDFGNDWFHADPDTLRLMMARYDLPANRLLRPHRTDFVESHLVRMRQELHAARLHQDEALGLLLESLCLHLARGMAEAGERRLSPRRAERVEAFRMLRAEIRADLAQPWTLAAMAERVHLSPSRFGALYREFFGIAPHDDLLQARLSHARWLLESTNLAVSEVAEATGFSSVYHFSRIFRRRCGCAPSACRG